VKTLAGPGARLRALRAGSLAARALGVPGAAPSAPTTDGPETPVDGVVASVHRRAVNLRLSSGTLVAVLPETSPLHPWAVTAAFDPGDLVAGLPVRIGRGAPPEGGAGLDATGASIADLSLRRRPDAVPRATIAELLEFLPPRAAADPFGPGIAAALARFRTAGEVEPLAGLIGLGEGLTPSGDDVVTGILAGLDLLQDADPAAGTARGRLVEALTPDVLGRTPLLSSQMLRAAVQGLYAEPVLELLDALHAPSAPHASLAEASNRLLAMGHRSGRDTLRGLTAVLLHF
jgi:hypothetical protein